MAHHVIVEFNLDKSHTFNNDLNFPNHLYLALAKRFLDSKEVLKDYGIKVLNEHHSSDCEKLMAKRDAATELYEALESAISCMSGYKELQDWVKQFKQAIDKADGRKE